MVVNDNMVLNSYEKKQKHATYRCLAKVCMMKKQLSNLQKRSRQQQDHITSLQVQTESQYKTNIKLFYFATIPYFLTLSGFICAQLIAGTNNNLNEL